MRWPILRDIALFLGGMGGVIHETLLTKAERPTLLILFAAMMGLPAFLQGGSSPTDAASNQIIGTIEERRAAKRAEAQERREIQAEVERQMLAQRRKK